jgi:arginase
MGSLKLITSKSELGAGTRGSSLGPEALEIAGVNAGDNLFNNIPRSNIPHQNKQLYQVLHAPNAKYIQSIYETCDKLHLEVKNAIEEGYFPLVLSGDHSNAGGTIAGIKSTHPDKTLGVIWIDAHADLHSPYTTPSGNVHGMPAAAALNVDNRKCQQHKIRQATSEYWEKMKSLGGIAPKLDFLHFAMVGVRDTESPGDTVIADREITNY